MISICGIDHYTLNTMWCVNWIDVRITSENMWSWHIWNIIGLFSVPTSGPQLVHQGLWYVLSCLWKVDIKDPLLLIGKNNLCDDSRFRLEKYAPMTICLTSNSRWKGNQFGLAASLNKTNFPFYLRRGSMNVHWNNANSWIILKFNTLVVININVRLYVSIISVSPLWNNYGQQRSKDHLYNIDTTGKQKRNISLPTPNTIRFWIWIYSADGF